MRSNLIGNDDLCLICNQLWRCEILLLNVLQEGSCQSSIGILNYNAAISVCSLNLNLLRNLYLRWRQSYLLDVLPFNHGLLLLFAGLRMVDVMSLRLIWVLFLAMGWKNVNHKPILNLCRYILRGQQRL